MTLKETQNKLIHNLGEWTVQINLIDEWERKTDDIVECGMEYLFKYKFKFKPYMLN